MKLESFAEGIDLENLRFTYICGKEYKSQGRGEIFPVRWENEVALPYAPVFLHVLLFLQRFANRVDEYYLYRKTERV